MNHLADETSPYLRQHADNPVEWYPWGDEALDRAAREDKPIFLSIGYASCHWCHVMAHESFEDDAVAADLSRWFISVKVDREERPDIDSLYMAATQALTGSGGWPMSVFCTPDGRPFYAGTYFPPVERHGMPSFRRVVETLGTSWERERDRVLAQAETLVDAVRREVRLDESLETPPAEPPDELPAEPSAGSRDQLVPAAGLDPDALIDQVVTGLAPGFDPTWGGFGPAPKFPRPSLVELCLRHHRRTGSERSRQMALTTLDAMAAGGMYDHLVGGFCRYSTDARWLVPHFEKMLTDQALLARAYLHAWQETGSEDYLGVVTETLDFVLRDLSTPQGALYSSFDADAGGVEGSHATFTLSELRASLPAGLVQPAADWYGITEEGNWEGRSIPHRPVGAPLRRPPEIEQARALLAAVRAGRPQPARDEKVLTEWNAMAAATLAEAAAVTGSDRYGQRAEEIGEFIMSAMYDGGRLMRSWQGGRARHLAVAADHAWLVAACVQLSELTGRRLWRERAHQVSLELLDRFSDEKSGGFFTTGDDAEALIVRPKEYLDGALPATNSIAVHALLRANALDDDRRVRDAVERAVDRTQVLLRRHPGAVADLVAALPLLTRRQEIVVSGDRADLLSEVRRRWLPDAVVAWGEPDGSPLFAGRPEGSAFVCQGFSCAAPANDAPTLAATRGSTPMSEGTADPIAKRPAHTPTNPARLLRRSARRREKIPTSGGSTLHLLVLSSTTEDTTVVDLATRTVMRVRVPWPPGYEPDITAFDVVEVTLADDPERDDLAQPEATTAADLPRHVGTLRGRQLRKLLRRMVAGPDGPLLGFPGPSAPYWEFRGFRPSVALIEPTRSPQLIRRRADGSTWVRFGWDRDDVWLPVEDRHAARALDAARRERLSGKGLAAALGFDPQYLLVTVSPPREGHCYKVCAAVLPRG